MSSLGCTGNRVYTGLREDELYVAVPGADLEKVAGALEIIVSANQAIADYARERRDTTVDVSEALCAALLRACGPHSD